MNRAEIKNLFRALQEQANELVGANLPTRERDQIRQIVSFALAVGESFMIDLNRIADACETIAQNTRP